MMLFYLYLLEWPSSSSFSMEARGSRNARVWNLTKLEFVGQRKSPYQIISVRWHSHPNRLLAHFERPILRGSFGKAHSERLIWRRSFGEAHLESSFWMIICKEFLTQKRWCKSYYSLLSQTRISDFFFTYRIYENSFRPWIVSTLE